MPSNSQILSMIEEELERPNTVKALRAAGCRRLEQLMSDSELERFIVKLEKVVTQYKLALIERVKRVARLVRQLSDAERAQLPAVPAVIA